MAQHAVAIRSYLGGIWSSYLWAISAAAPACQRRAVLPHCVGIVLRWKRGPGPVPGIYSSSEAIKKSIFKILPRHWAWVCVAQNRCNHSYWIRVGERLCISKTISYNSLFPQVSLLCMQWATELHYVPKQAVLSMMIAVFLFCFLTLHREFVLIFFSAFFVADFAFPLPLYTTVRTKKGEDPTSGIYPPELSWKVWSLGRT